MCVDFYDFNSLAAMYIIPIAKLVANHHVLHLKLSHTHRQGGGVVKTKSQLDDGVH